MNINDLNLDELQPIDNNFLANWIKKDLTTGKHFAISRSISGILPKRG